MSVASAKTQEPSMEDILASIRRIIADDQDAPKPPEAEAEPELQPAGAKESSPVADPPGETFDLAAAVPVEVPPDPSKPVAASPPLSLSDLEVGVPDILFAEPQGEPKKAPSPEPPPAFPAGKLPRAGREGPKSLESLISNQTTASVGQAFNMLSHTVLSQNARTLEDLVQELLKPMLKVWLDDNLPPLVERLVRAEIERVARGRS